MKIHFFILVIFSAGTYSSVAAKPASRFPDFLAPLRSIFGSRQQPQQVEQRPPKEYSRPQGNKDQSIAETSKPNAENSFNDDTGFRPFFPSNFEDQPNSYSTGNGESQYQPQQHQPFNSQPQYTGGQNNRPQPQHAPYSQNNRPRPPRHGQRPFQNRPPPHAAGNEERYPNSQEGSPDFSFSPQNFGGGFPSGQQHFGPPQNRFPQPHGHRKPFQPSQPLNDFEGQISERPQALPYSAQQYVPQGFSQQESIGNQQYQPQGENEPPIITLDDVQKQGGLNTYSNGPFNNGAYPGEYYNDQNNIFASPGQPESNNNPIFQSNPLKPLVSHGPPSFSTNSEEASLFHEGSQHKKVTVKPGRGFRRYKIGRGGPRPSASTNEDVHYGKPMMMSASTPSAVKKIKPPKNMERRHPKKSVEPRKPILLSSPKLPNYVKSPSIHAPVSQPYEPNQAATSHGHGGGHGDLGAMTSNGDRILYHVAGHQGPYSYRFGYDTGHGYNRMFRHEEKDGSGYVKGKYGFYDKHGKLNIVNYEAHPKHGFHAEKGHR